MKSSPDKFLIHNCFGSCTSPQIIGPDVTFREITICWTSMSPCHRVSSGGAEKAVKDGQMHRSVFMGVWRKKLSHLLQTKTGITLLVGGKIRAHLDFFHLKIEGEISRKQTYALSHRESWALGISWGFSRPGRVQLQQKISFKISPSMAQSQDVSLPAEMPSKRSWGVLAMWRSDSQCRTLFCNLLSQGHSQSCWTGKQKREEAALRQTTTSTQKH